MEDGGTFLFDGQVTTFLYLDGWTTDDLRYQWKTEGPVQIVKDLHLPRNPFFDFFPNGTPDNSKLNPIDSLTNVQFYRHTIQSIQRGSQTKFKDFFLAYATKSI